ncbi:hypothetical protein Cylst_4626 [Cylindrospermum stagnale PCC 7417]|uniref:WD40 repeat-containing protein n=1 Tax=Cylindrospermum stagnale PCC 7417 TaxID=56107 RepID=K9X3R2_9NOST|nr:hypothetical protein [Cylindrospermum stagnale]AFZ26696.1 hypothetical protein Cylst_4626 [Cylindrospermum stagnale PCC 7417]
MISTILKARTIAITTVSPDGRLLAASDDYNYLYIVDIETGTLLFEKELDYDLESLHFDRTGKRLFLNDGIVVKVYSILDFTEISLPAIQEFDDPTGLKFLDSQPSGEVLLFLPVNGRIYHLDPLGEKCHPIAFIPYDSVSGKYLGQEFNKLILSASDYSPRITILNLEGDVLLQKVFPVTEWEEGELLSIALNGRHSLLQNSFLIIRDARLNELSKWQLSKVTPRHLCAISPNMDIFGIIEDKGVQLFDARTGQKQDFIPTSSYGPSNIIFFEKDKIINLICSMIDGEVLLLPLI